MYTGLKDNIRFLYRMFNDFKSSGYDVVVVGKAYDDNLQAYTRNDVEKNMIRYNGLTVWIVSGFSDIEGFEKKKNYMKSVDESFILEAVRRMK